MTDAYLLDRTLPQSSPRSRPGAWPSTAISLALHSPKSSTTTSAALQMMVVVAVNVALQAYVPPGPDTDEALGRSCVWLSPGGRGWRRHLAMGRVSFIRPDSSTKATRDSGSSYSLLVTMQKTPTFPMWSGPRPPP